MSTNSYETNAVAAEDTRRAYVFNGFRLVPSEFRLERLQDGSALLVETLTPLALELLLCFVKSGGRLLTREAIFGAVWRGTAVEDGALNAQVKHLRELLGDEPKSPTFIQTLPRRGHKFLPPVREEWLDAESEAKNRTGPGAYSGTHDPRRAWVIDLAGEWHAIWETSAHRKRNVNHEVVTFEQLGATVTLRNTAASDENPDGGYLWEGRLTIHDNRHLVGAYWSVDRTVNARGTLFLVVNRTGKFVTGVWAGCNIDSDVACGRVALGRSHGDARAEFKRMDDGVDAGSVGAPLFGARE